MIYTALTTYEIHIIIVSYHIISYHIVDLKRQNRLKVGTSKPKLKVTMQSVSDDDIRKRLFEKPRFELAAKGVFRLGTGKMLHLLAGHSRYSGQQLGKHGYRRLIA